ncbi:exodeoxyribonuclease III [Pontibacter sp. HSC-14F20]|uniref:exodeoxyribonuclease III n=1 Tax=Pontibacter sp. HSC-14F20 TaxID=2864136 RepID=UPI001C731AAC|nr:exodeoxyribonuclease III [Pontibacter sp. HSC-14F20]MBX0333687.1 exodeoxyribonuclease III [Pontibacter sp. HSC-14F20]
MKVITYNVNGIRAAISKGFQDWVKAASPDVLCLQEIKACEDKFDRAIFEDMGYNVYLHPAVKKGYSGVAILSKVKPKHVEIGCGMECYDNEGRVIRADFDDYSVMSVYMPSGSSGDERQGFKMQWLEDFYGYIGDLKQTLPGIVISGDYNICHQAIDIHNPKSNANSSGFLPEERNWMTKFIESGFVDSFRHFNKEPHNYSWWSYRAGARAKNLGWRIDYNMVTGNLQDRMQRAAILPEAKHSDHCPVLLDII